MNINGGKIIDYIQGRTMLLNNSQRPLTLGELSWAMASPRQWKEWERLTVKDLEYIDDEWYYRVILESGAWEI